MLLRYLRNFKSATASILADYDRNIWNLLVWIGKIAKPQEDAEKWLRFLSSKM